MSEYLYSLSGLTSFQPLADQRRLQTVVNIPLPLPFCDDRLPTSRTVSFRVSGHSTVCVKAMLLTSTPPIPELKIKLKPLWTRFPSQMRHSLVKYSWISLEQQSFERKINISLVKYIFHIWPYIGKNVIVYIISSSCFPALWNSITKFNYRPTCILHHIYQTHL